MARVALAMALVPAVVVVILVLVQGGTLASPSPAPVPPSAARSASALPSLSATSAALGAPATGGRRGTAGSRTTAADRTQLAALQADRTALNSDQAQLSALGGDRSSALTYGWIAAAAVLVFGLLAFLRLRATAAARAPERRPEERGGAAERRPEERGGAAERRPGGRAVAPLPDLTAQAQLVRDREELVEACISAVDAAGGLGERQQLLRALEQAGVTAVEVPANTRFDPAEHKAAEAIPTDEPSLDGLVAGTERPGFLDRGRRLRWPEVVVYRAADRGRSV